MEKQRPRVVIVGGGFGGLDAARALRKASVQVTIIDRNNHYLFQPLLYQIATAGLSPADIAAPIRNILRRQRNVEVLMAEVIGVDTERRCVHTHDLSVPYDYLILATGATDSYFGHSEWEQYAPSLKTLTDATAIRRKILMAFEAAEMESDPELRRVLLTFLLVGGGPTGVEMAGAIAELAHRALASDFRRIDPRSAKIVLLEAGPRILSTFDPSLSAAAQKALQRLGVEVRTNAKVEKIDAEGVEVAGQRIASRTVLWAAGVTASPAGNWLGTETDRAGRTIVQADLSVPGHPDIFVIGDTAHIKDTPLPGVAQVAMQEGRYAANLILRRIQEQAPPPPFHYHDKGNLATVGRSFAVLESGRWKLSGFVAWVLWLVIHIYYLIGFQNRLLVLVQWAWAYISFYRGARLIVTDSAAETPEALLKSFEKPPEKIAP